jgi:hypothetical protein
MAVGWSGPDPVGEGLDPGSTYELGTRFSTVGAITVTGIRVYGGSSSVARSARKARLWSGNGTQLAVASLPDQMPPGWTTYALPDPVTLTAGSSATVSYSVTESYTAMFGASMPMASADGNISVTTGALQFAAPGSYPTQAAPGVFYGVDIEYSLVTGKRATAEGVAAAWAGTLALPAVATTLPELGSWPVLAGTVRGFVVIDGVVGGTPRDTALRSPVIGISTWAAVPDSDRPQWGAANDLAEVILRETYRHPFVPVTVRQSPKHRYAIVHSVRVLSEPRRVPDPDEGRAHYVLDASIFWTEVT